MSDVTPWTLVVLRAWRDPDGFKVRLLYEDHDRVRRSAVCCSTADACRVVAGWLAGHEGTRTEGETEP